MSAKSKSKGKSKGRSKGYDPEMIRDFLDHLHCELEGFILDHRFAGEKPPVEVVQKIESCMERRGVSEILPAMMVNVPREGKSADGMAMTEGLVRARAQALYEGMLKALDAVEPLMKWALKSIRERQKSGADMVVHKIDVDEFLRMTEAPQDEDKE